MENVKRKSFLYTSENNIVDQVGMISFSGNIIPHTWYRTITRDNGKPYLLAITLLSDIVYWYRPAEVRDELTGQLVGWRKKFREDLLQRSYDQFANMFGESKRAVTDAIVRLEKLGVIKRVFRTVEIPGGLKMNNVLYIFLNVEKLEEITFPVVEDNDSDSKMENLNTNKEENKNKEKKETVEKPDLSASATPIPKFRDRGISENVTPVTEFRDRVSRNFGTGLPEFCETNTKNTTENTYIDYNRINPSKYETKDSMDSIEPLTPIQERHVYQEIIKENIALDDLLITHPYEQQMILEIYELLIDAVSSDRETLRIARENIPQQIVKNRLLKLRYEHVNYILLCLKNNPVKIRNIKAYLLSCLYNAPATMDSYYTTQVNHDMSQPSDVQLE